MYMYTPASLEQRYYMGKLSNFDFLRDMGVFHTFVLITAAEHLDAVFKLDFDCFWFLLVDRDAVEMHFMI